MNTKEYKLKLGFMSTLNFKKRNLVFGFSLIEIIIYLAIFTTLSVLVINSFIIILSSFNTTNTNRKLLESGLNSMERISREIRQAKNIDIPNSSFDVLQLNSTNNLGNIIIKFSSSGGSLNLYENGNLIGNLLNQNINLTGLIFRNIITTKGEAVKIEMTIQDLQSKSLKSVNFYNTVILRGGY